MIINNPFTDKSPAEIQSCFADRNTEKDLADAYAVSSNMFWWTADNIDDYDEDSPETAQIHVLRPFMEQNGYICHSGWWYPENE